MRGRFLINQKRLTPMPSIATIPIPTSISRAELAFCFIYGFKAALCGSFVAYKLRPKFMGKTGGVSQDTPFVGTVRQSASFARPIWC